MICREEHGRPQHPIAHGQEGRTGCDHGRLRQGVDEGSASTVEPHRCLRRRAVDVGLRHHEHITETSCRGEGRRGQCRDCAIEVHAKDAVTHGIVIGRDEDVIGAGIEECRDLQADRGQRLAIDAEAIGVGGAIGHDVEQSPVAGTSRHPRHDVDPLRVGSLIHHDGGGGVGRHLQHELASLVTRQEREQRVGIGGDVDLREVGPGLVIPLDLGARGAIDIDAPKRDIGVVGAGSGIPVLLRGRCRVGRVGDPPGLHGRVVDALDQEPRSVGEPPVAAHPVELLGRVEVGQAP